MTDFPSIGVTLAEWEEQLGDAVRQLRINAGYDQVELAERANVSRSAIQSLEQGAGTRLHTLLAVLRALDRRDAFQNLMPESGPTPLEILTESRRATRQRRHRTVER